MDKQEKAKQAEQREQSKRELRRAIIRAVDGDQQKALREMLIDMAMASSYMKGRSAEDVAFAEGKRAFAAYLLREGGIYGRGSGANTPNSE